MCFIYVCHHFLDAVKMIKFSILKVVFGINKLNLNGTCGGDQNPSIPSTFPNNQEK